MDYLTQKVWSTIGLICNTSCLEQRWAFIEIIFRQCLITIIAQNTFDLSITDRAFEIYFVIADKL